MEEDVGEIMMNKTDCSFFRMKLRVGKYRDYLYGEIMIINSFGVFYLRNDFCFKFF